MTITITHHHTFLILSLFTINRIEYSKGQSCSLDSATEKQAFHQHFGELHDISEPTSLLLLVHPFFNCLLFRADLLYQRAKLMPVFLNLVVEVISFYVPEDVLHLLPDVPQSCSLAGPRLQVLIRILAEQFE